MKNLSLLIIFITICYITSLNAQWYEKTNGLPDSWMGLSFDAYDSLVAVGPLTLDDSLYITTDAGDNWNTRPLPFDYHGLFDLIDISIIGKDRIWFCTEEKIYASNDGGFNWEIQFYDTAMTKFINYIEMFDSLDGVAMGDAPAEDKPALFLSTTNGGNNWISMNDSSLIGLYSGDIFQRIDFVDINTGYFFASGESPQNIYKTTNGGKNWVSVNDSIYCVRIKFYDENIGLAINTFVWNVHIYRTTDGGLNWEYFPFSDSLGWVQDIEFIPSNPSRVWFTTNKSAFSHSGLFFSSDTGRTWSQQSYPLDWNYREIVFTDGEHGWLYCYDLQVERDYVFYTNNGGLGGIVSANEQVNGSVLKGFHLSHNSPNPFNPITTIKYQIPELSFITLKVYDVLGNEIVTLVNEEKPVGNYKVEFDATALPSGIYFYRLQTGSFVETKKMVLMK